MCGKRTVGLPIAAVALVLVAGAARAAGEVNLAPLGTATQSTTLGAYGPELGINGNLGDFTHTLGTDLAPFWQVTLPAEFDIVRIVLRNRTSCCGSRLRDITVLIQNDAGTETRYASALLNPENALGAFPNGPAQLTVDLAGQPGGAVKGTIVRVERTPDPDLSGTGGQGNTDEAAVLSLGEVEVFGSGAGLPPTITRQPVGGRVNVGGSFTFSVQAIGAEPLNYQWRRNDVDVPGATSSTLVLDSVTKAHAGTYIVVVTNAVDDVVSDPAELVVPGKNLATGGQASQSSVGYGGLPGRANDGNTAQAWGAGSTTHTSETPLDPAPWWEVKLPGLSTIESISLWNRSDCCSTRLSNFKVSVLGETRNEVFSEEFFTDGAGYVDPVAPLDIPLPANTKGTFVRVELLGANAIGERILSLVEVEAFGDGPDAPPDPNPNLARGGTATQSTICYTMPAQLAINGSLVDITHTCFDDPAPFWQVTLPGETDIARIVLHNRANGWRSRLRDITVLIQDATGTETRYTSDLLNPENVLGSGTLEGPMELVVDLIAETGGAVKGTIVRVQRTPDPDLSGSGGQGNADEAAVLSLAEVEVYGPLNCPAQGDTHCAGIQAEGPGAGTPGLYWVYATATDDSGDVPYVTFTADDGVNPPAVSGPERVYSMPFMLRPGTWTITVKVDDSFSCPDAAANATCTTQLTLAVDPNDVAFGGTATQSTTNGAAAASRAIDGITNGILNLGSVSLTATTDVAPWWEVDLGQAFSLDRIVLWNRTDPCAGCRERLSNFRVRVLDESRGELFSQDFFTDLTGFVDTPTEGFAIELPAKPSGRFVRIEILGAGTSGETILTLAEVEVFKVSGGGVGVFMGNANGDGTVNIADAVTILGYLFGKPPKPAIPCFKAADTNDDNTLNVADAVDVLTFLFGAPSNPSKPMTGPDGSAINTAACRSYPATDIPATIIGQPGCATPCAAR